MGISRNLIETALLADLADALFSGMQQRVKNSLEAVAHQFAHS